MAMEKILLTAVDRVIKILNVKSTNKKELYQRQIAPIYENLKEHNEVFLAVSSDLRGSLDEVIDIINAQPNDNDLVVRALKVAKNKMSSTLSEGQTDRSSIRNLSLEFSSFPFYSRPVVGCIEDELRQQIIDYFDSVNLYFSFSGSGTHAMRHSLGILAVFIKEVEAGRGLDDVRRGVDRITEELDFAEKHLMDRWGIVARKKGRLEVEIFHG